MMTWKTVLFFLAVQIVLFVIVDAFLALFHIDPHSKTGWHAYGTVPYILWAIDRWKRLT